MFLPSPLKNNLVNDTVITNMIKQLQKKHHLNEDAINTIRLSLTNLSFWTIFEEPLTYHHKKSPQENTAKNHIKLNNDKFKYTLEYLIQINLIDLFNAYTRISQTSLHNAHQLADAFDTERAYTLYLSLGNQTCIADALVLNSDLKQELHQKLKKPFNNTPPALPFNCTDSFDFVIDDAWESILNTINTTLQTAFNNPISFTPLEKVDTTINTISKHTSLPESDIKLALALSMGFEEGFSQLEKHYSHKPSVNIDTNNINNDLNALQALTIKLMHTVEPNPEDRLHYFQTPIHDCCNIYQESNSIKQNIMTYEEFQENLNTQTIVNYVVCMTLWLAFRKGINNKNNQDINTIVECLTAYNQFMFELTDAFYNHNPLN